METRKESVDNLLATLVAIIVRLLSGDLSSSTTVSLPSDRKSKDKR